MNSTLRRGLTAVLTVACVTAGTTEVAAAKTSDTYRVYPCGSAKAGGKPVVLTRLIAAQKGSKLVVYAGSFARAQHLACTGARRGVALKEISLTWTITAKGVGINGCGVSFPLGLDCSGSGSTQTLVFEDSNANDWRDEVELPSGFYLDAGRFGNFTKVCSNVTAKFKGTRTIYGTTTACVDV